MNYKRIARMLVCLVLVCALVVNISPIKAEAIVGEAVATYVGYGIVAALVLGTAGFVISPTGQDQLENLGHAFQTSMYQWGTSAEKLDEVEEFFTGLMLYNGSTGGGDDDDDDLDRIFKIPEAIRRGVAALTAGAILASSLVVPDKLNEAPEGYAYYNGILAPDFPSGIDDYPYKLLEGDLEGVVYLFASEVPFYLDSGDLPSLYPYESVNYKFCKISASDLSTGDWGKLYTGSNATFIGSNTVLWANYDVLNYSDKSTVLLSGMQPTSYATVFVEPDIYVGDIPDKLKDGSVTEDTLELPLYEFDYSGLAASNPDLSLATTALLQSVANGSITYDDYLASLQPAVVPDPLPNPKPEPDPEPDPSTGTDDEELILGDTKTNTFFETLTDIVTAPSKWIWEKLDTKLDILKPPEFYFDKLTSIITDPAEWIWPKIQTYFEPLLNPDVWLQPLPDVLEVPFRKTWEYIQAIPQEIADAAKELATEIKAIPEKLAEVGRDLATHIQVLPDHIADAATNIATQIQALPDYIVDAATQLQNAIESLVVPDKDYLTDKIDDLCREFVFADSIVETTQQLGNCLVGITTTPPVIYIDLGAARGSYDFGDKVPFLDLRWYAEYKPTVDALISGFLWACFIWRTFVKLPGIINGAAGDFVLIQSRREDYYNDR